MVMVPATVSNNIPGSDLSIGADTALNAITDVRQHTLVLESVCVWGGGHVYLFVKSTVLSVRYAKRPGLMIANLSVRKHTGQTKILWDEVYFCLLG